MFHLALQTTTEIAAAKVSAPDNLPWINYLRVLCEIRGSFAKRFWKQNKIYILFAERILSTTKHESVSRNNTDLYTRVSGEVWLCVVYKTLPIPSSLVTCEDFFKGYLFSNLCYRTNYFIYNGLICKKKEITLLPVASKR